MTLYTKIVLPFSGIVLAVASIFFALNIEVSDDGALTSHNRWSSFIYNKHDDPSYTGVVAKTPAVSNTDEEVLVLKSRKLSGEDREGFQSEVSDDGLLFVILVLGIGVFLHFLLQASKKWFPLPYSVSLVILGAVLGSINSIGNCVQEDLESTLNCSLLKHAHCADEAACTFESTLPLSLGALGPSIDVWVDISPHFLLFFFIPALVYGSAHAVDVHIFRESFTNVLFLAVPGVLIGTTLMGYFFHFAFENNERYGWSIDACMCLGSILAATDPVAVVALLHELGAPHRLGIVIEGESLFNDGTALVLFSIFSRALRGIEFSPSDMVVFFFRLALGGVAAGFLVGLLSVGLFNLMSNWVQETAWTIAAAYLTFFACENEYVHFSGVLGVVTLGIVVGFWGKPRLDRPNLLAAFWNMFNFIANTLIFTIAGAIIAESIFFEDFVQPEDWGYLVIIYVIQMAIRALTILILSPILHWSGKKNGYQLDIKDMILLWWSGLRGAVGLILALEVALYAPELFTGDQQTHCPNLTLTLLDDGTADPYCVGHYYIIGNGTEADVERFQALLTFFVAGFALLTLIINGPTTRYFVSCLQLTRKSTGKKFAYAAASRRLEELIRDTIEDYLKHDELYCQADWNRVWKAIPLHHWQGHHSCGKVVLGGANHDIITEAGVDVQIQDKINDLNDQMHDLMLKLENAKDYRQNQLVKRLSCNSEIDEDASFEKLFVLYQTWAADKGCAAAAKTSNTRTQGPESKLRQRRVPRPSISNLSVLRSHSINSYSYRCGEERPFTLDEAFLNSEGTSGADPRVEYVKQNWVILQELRRRFLMLVTANYFSQQTHGLVGLETWQDLQEVNSHVSDTVVKFASPDNIKGFMEDGVYNTLQSLEQFGMNDWDQIWSKFTRCRGSVKRCFNNHSEELRLSKQLDAFSSFRAAHSHAVAQYLGRYQRSMRKLDELVSAGPNLKDTIKKLLGRQIMQDHPLLLDVVMCESETSLDKARLAINAQTSKISPVTLATHQAVMHLLAMQAKEINKMEHEGMIDHEEAEKLLSEVNKSKADRVLRSTKPKNIGTNQIMPESK